MSEGLSLSLGVGVRGTVFVVSVDVRGTVFVVRCRCQRDCLCR